jgi:hypothetical protein
MIQIASIPRFLPTLSLMGGRMEPAALVRAGFNSRLFSVLKESFICMSLWITMPLAIWLSSGWIGLFIVLQAVLGAASLHTLPTLKPRLGTAGMGPLARMEILEGEVPCPLIKTETH